MAHTINEETAAIIEAVLVALDIPHPATVGDEKAWLWCRSNRAMHVVIALRMIRERSAGVEWNLARLRERLAEHPPIYGTWTAPEPATGDAR